MKYRLDDICEFINGGTWSDKEYTDDGIPVLKVSNIKRNGFAIEELNYIPYELLNKYRKHLLRVGDVVIATVGSHPNLVESAAGRSCVITQQVKDFLLNQNAVCIRSKNKDVLLQSYLGSLCKTRDFQHFIQMRGKGAANQMRIAISAIKDYECDIPDLLTQKQIGESLSAYDELVENNQKQIKLLEEAAQRLYKEWFIDLRFPSHETTPIINGIPEGWTKTNIDCLCELLKTSIVPDEIESNTPYIGLEHMPRKDFCLSTWDDSSSISSNKYFFKRRNILFGKIRPYFHKVGFAITDGVTSTDSFVIEPKQEIWGLFLLTVSSDAFVNYAYKTCKEGAKMPRADWNQMKEYPLLVAKESIQKQFEKNISKITKQIEVLAIQNLKLIEARDRLLPKLMSGEIEV